MNFDAKQRLTLNRIIRVIYMTGLHNFFLDVGISSDHQIQSSILVSFLGPRPNFYLYI